MHRCRTILRNLSFLPAIVILAAAPGAGKTTMIHALTLETQKVTYVEVSRIIGIRSFPSRPTNAWSRPASVCLIVKPASKNSNLVWKDLIYQPVFVADTSGPAAREFVPERLRFTDSVLNPPSQVLKS